MPRLIARLLPVFVAGVMAGPPAAAVDIVIVRSGGDLPGHAEAIAAFKKVTLSGDVLEIEARAGAIDAAIAQKLKEAPPKVMLAFGDVAAKAAAAMKVAPVIHGLVVDPSKLTESSGISCAIPDELKLRALAALSPSIKRIGVLHGAARKGEVAALAAAASDLGLTVTGSEIAGVTSIPPTLRQLLVNVDAMLVIPDETLGSSEAMKFVFENTLEASKPSGSFLESHLSQGAVVVVTPDPEDVGTRLGELVNAALKGPQAASLLAPSRFKLSVNTRAAAHLGFDLDTKGASVDGNIASRRGSAEEPPLIGVAQAAPVSAVADGPPTVLETATPDYPPMARKQKLTGEVVLDVTVGKDGNVVQAKVLKGSSMFNDAATQAVMKYRFQPALKGGQPAEGNVQITVSFGM